MIANETAVVAEIKVLQDGIEQKARSCVRDAQRIGQLLKDVQKDLEKCNSCTFPEWVEAHCSFSRRTAYNYMDLFNYRMRLAETSSFSDAYKKIEEIKLIEHQSEEQKARERVDIAYETGRKPEGWRQHTDDKLLEQKKIDEENRRAYEENRRIQIERFKAEEEERLRAKKAEADAIENARRVMADAVDNAMRVESWKSRLHLSGNNSDIENLIIGYLNDLENDTRRIECCQNIIKVCRKIAVDLTADNKDGF